MLQQTVKQTLNQDNKVIDKFLRETMNTTINKIGVQVWRWKRL